MSFATVWSGNYFSRRASRSLSKNLSQGYRISHNIFFFCSESKIVKADEHTIYIVFFVAQAHLDSNNGL